jgi:hypothetical protein
MTLERGTRPYWLNLSSSVFAVGLLLLAASLYVWSIWLQLFTEAMLVPWYCCDPAGLPPLGSWQRTFNDFFATSPGRFLPLLIFFLTEGIIFWSRLRRDSDRTWLPMLFCAGNVLLFLLSLAITNLSWWVSNQVVGPRIGGIDAGYHRTWYGIVSHLSLWLLFFVALAKIRLPDAARG